MGITGTASMALVLVALDVAASLIGLATFLAPQVAIPDHGFQLAITVSGLPAAALLLWLRHRFDPSLPVFVIHAWVAVSVVMVCLGSWSARTAPTAIASLAFFVWIGLFVGHFFPTRQTIVHLGWIALCLSVLLASNGDRATTSVGIMTFGIVVVATGASRYLSIAFGQVATTDALTGLPNRLVLDRLFDDEIARANESGVALAVAIIDVDHFKEVNDRDGHLVGDDVLVSLATHLKAGLPPTDTLVRYGGDEFVVVMPGCALTDARDIVDQLRGTSGLAVSAGITSWAPGDGAFDLLHRADQALYRAKSSGRNHVALAGPRTPSQEGNGREGEGARGARGGHGRPARPERGGRGALGQRGTRHRSDTTKRAQR